jgi:hypothetical protein
MTQKPMNEDWKKQIEIVDSIYKPPMELSTILAEHMTTLSINVNGGSFQYVPDNDQYIKLSTIKTMIDGMEKHSSDFVDGDVISVDDLLTELEKM